ncbi:MAG TPA: hypothetical protein VN667_00190 [Burkholderiales bacterium]|nr:hypothetical protein [Burkholderiales bacterium]
MKRFLLTTTAVLAIGTAMGAAAQQGAPSSMSVGQQQKMAQNPRSDCYGLSGRALSRCVADQRHDRVVHSRASADDPAKRPAGTSNVNPGVSGTDTGGGR